MIFLHARSTASKASNSRDSKSASNGRIRDDALQEQQHDRRKLRVLVKPLALVAVGDFETVQHQFRPNMRTWAESSFTGWLFILFW